MMPLQIFEKHPEADAYRVGHAFTPYAYLATEKRFTEAELAAAYWQARAMGAPVLRADAIHRFASLPDYDAA